MKPLVCIFAHPDDEAFGPGGTIALEAKKRPVYIISATKGEAGLEKGKKAGNNLGRIRTKELLASARILGVKKVFFLGFRDGTLSNNLYHELAKRIERILRNLKPDTILSYEFRGVSGHIDHITVALVAAFVFRRLPFIKTLMQHCIPEATARGRKDYFIYFPPGYKKSEIDLTVDIRAVWETKVKAMTPHQSQIHDIKRILKMAKNWPKKEYFLLQRK